MFSLATFFLTACELADKRTLPDGPTNTKVLALFMSNQLAVSNWNALRNQSSMFQGFVLVATEDSTFDGAINPPIGHCMPSSQDVLHAGPIRYLDVGDIALRGPSVDEVTIPKSERNTFGVGNFPLPFGDTYRLQTAGVRDGVMKWRQEFRVLPMASNLTFRVASTGVTTAMPTPVIPDPAHPEQIPVIDLDKRDGGSLAYRAPEGTSYVKVMIVDGSNDEEGSVTCYGSATGPIDIPPGTFNFFRSTDQGFMTIDFVQTSLRTDVPRVDESLIVSSTRHIYGRKDIPMVSPEGEAQTVEIYFGKLVFR